MFNKHRLRLLFTWEMTRNYIFLNIKFKKSISWNGHQVMQQGNSLLPVYIKGFCCCKPSSELKYIATDTTSNKLTEPTHPPQACPCAGHIKQPRASSAVGLIHLIWSVEYHPRASCMHDQMVSDRAVGSDKISNFNYLSVIWESGISLRHNDWLPFIWHKVLLDPNRQPGGNSGGDSLEEILAWRHPWHLGPISWQH